MKNDCLESNPISCSIRNEDCLKLGGVRVSYRLVEFFKRGRKSDSPRFFRSQPAVMLSKSATVYIVQPLIECHFSRQHSGRSENTLSVSFSLPSSTSFMTATAVMHFETLVMRKNEPACTADFSSRSAYPYSKHEAHLNL